MKRLQTLGKHGKFVTAVIEKDFVTARKLTKNSYKSSPSDYRLAESVSGGVEQYQKDAIWNYFHGNSEQSLKSLPKRKKGLDTEQS